LTIRTNCSVAIKVLNALRSPDNKEPLVSSGNIILPRLRGLEFHRLDDFDDRNEAPIDEFLHELECFLIFRSKVEWDDVELGRKNGFKGLEFLTLGSSLYNENYCYKDYVPDFDCLADKYWWSTPYRFHELELDERWSDGDDAESDLVFSSDDDNGLDAERGG
jgi:hypothetical protein